MSETIRRLLTERQAADKLAVSPRTLQNWRRYGEGPRCCESLARLFAMSRATLTHGSTSRSAAARTSDPGPLAA
ncbi:MAG: helix-turn-helix domain-containing protein [Chromatiales bacterium]|nr:helix-turn-helix domain-containing protein [Chromatiales bacterium]